MPTAKVAISIDQAVLQHVDRLVALQLFPNRSKAFQNVMQHHLTQLDRSRLAKECAKLHPHEEQLFAEEGFSMERSAWPEF